jgi:hypothetical protein
MRRLALLLVVLVSASACQAGHSPAWKAADLDRNRFDLGLHRDAHEGKQLAEWVEHGEVVQAQGRSAYGGGGDLEIVVAYPRQSGGGGGLFSGEPETTCYRFTSPDGYLVDFDEVDCPS